MTPAPARSAGARRARAGRLLVAGVLVATAACSAAGGGDSATPVRWLALGDSYSSAEGLPGAVGRCARSDRAYASQAREMLEGELPVEAFVNHACSGARLADVAGQVAEASAAAGDAAFNLVTVTIGGNDVGFARVLADCSGVDDLVDTFVEGLDGVGCDLPDADLVARAASLADELVPAYEAIVDSLAADGVVVVLGYPNLHADPATWAGGRRHCEGISPADAARLRTMAAALDRALTVAAAAVDRVQYVSVLDLFAGHELCGPEEPWLHGVSLGISARTLRPQGSFHPNEAGHRAEAELLVETLRRLYGVEAVPMLGG